MKGLLFSFAIAVAPALMCAPLHAETSSIFHATLGETGKTPEISTEQMRQVLSSNSAIVLDTRSRAEFDADISRARQISGDSLPINLPSDDGARQR